MKSEAAVKVERADGKFDIALSFAKRCKRFRIGPAEAPQGIARHLERLGDDAFEGGLNARCVRLRSP